MNHVTVHLFMRRVQRTLTFLANMMESAGPEGIDMMSQEGAMSTGGIGGMTPEAGGMYANPNAML